MSNRLKYEKSPYLLQHAENPVDWYAWGEEAFQKAKKEWILHGYLKRKATMKTALDRNLF